MHPLLLASSADRALPQASEERWPTQHGDDGVGFLGWVCVELTYVSSFIRQWHVRQGYLQLVVWEVDQLEAAVLQSCAGHTRGAVKHWNIDTVENVLSGPDSPVRLYRASMTCSWVTFSSCSLEHKDGACKAGLDQRSEMSSEASTFSVDKAKHKRI